jgi:hypothetical protein
MSQIVNSFVLFPFTFLNHLNTIIKIRRINYPKHNVSFSLFLKSWLSIYIRVAAGAGST